LALGAKTAGRDLGVRVGFYDLAQTIADGLGLPPRSRGVSFLPQVT
jgi:phosphopentomutase